MKAKNIVRLPVSNLARQAAEFCGLPLVDWLQRRLMEAAVNDIQRAHNALCEAGVRNKVDIEHRERIAHDRVRAAEAKRDAKRRGEIDLNKLRRDYDKARGNHKSFVIKGHDSTVTDSKAFGVMHDIANTSLILWAQRHSDDYRDRFNERPDHLGEAHIIAIHNAVWGRHPDASDSVRCSIVLSHMEKHKVRNTVPEVHV